MATVKHRGQTKSAVGGANPAAVVGEARGERERQPDEVREWSE